MIVRVINIGTGYLNRPNAVITIDTGYQNRPTWLWRTTLFITGSHGCLTCFPANSVLWQARDPSGGEDLFCFARQLSTPNQTGYIRGVQYCNRVCIWMFLVSYIVTGCISGAPRALTQGQVLTPPPPPAAPPYPVERRVPPPPPGLHLSKVFSTCTLLSLHTTTTTTNNNVIRNWEHGAMGTLAWPHNVSLSITTANQIWIRANPI